jgi:hypothetical protein
MLLKVAKPKFTTVASLISFLSEPRFQAKGMRDMRDMRKGSAVVAQCATYLSCRNKAFHNSSE